MAAAFAAYLFEAHAESPLSYQRPPLVLGWDRIVSQYS
jgi:hypothetical protein